jgi:hypothetical protein
MAFCACLAHAADNSTASCHHSNKWTAHSINGTGETGATQNKDYKLTPDAIAKLPLYRDIKITVNDSGEIAVPDLLINELNFETDKEVIRYKGTFTKAFNRDTFTRNGDRLVLLPPPCRQT